MSYLRSFRLRPLLAALALLFGPAAAPCAAQPAPADGPSGAVTGVVQLPPRPSRATSLRGNLYRNRLAPDAAAVESDPGASDPEGRQRPPELDVVISAHPLDRPAPLSTAPLPARMVQQEATFQPHVLPIRVGARVEFVNKDRFYHNVFSLSGAGFDLGRKPTGEIVTHTFTDTGEVEVFCDIHPQMNATVLVLATPWFTRPDSAGAFRLDGLPAGRYRLQAYHPERERLQRDIEVGPGVPVSQDFSFGR